MQKQIYKWKRFWCPRTGNVALTDGGYLSDPDSEYGHIYNPDVLPYDKIVDTPCLILLGEPGIGKTQAIIDEKNCSEATIQSKGDKLLWFDLKEYGSEDRLIRDVFECEDLISWKNSNFRLYIFFDSLDECRIRINNLISLLSSKVQKLPKERLSLRIICRTLDWPPIFERNLNDYFGANAVKIYELAPLRRVDVIEAAKINYIHPDTFISEIDRVEAVPFAIKPVTLNFLINTYRKEGNLPSTQFDLYQRGCLLLCEEPCEERRETCINGNLDPAQLMIIAARIAAVTIFSNRYAVWIGVDRGDIPDEDISIESLCVGKERNNDQEFLVNNASIKGALATGLFSSRGLYRMGFAHKTYAEFLAAFYLLHHNMAASQIMSLIIHPDDPNGKLVPQLYETSAWLAGMSPCVYQSIIDTDPEVLLKSDVAKASPKDRENLVDKLLTLFDEEKLHDRISDIHRYYEKLLHPRLAEQIKPYIVDKSKNEIVRRVAIEIASSCGLKILQESLLIIALDPQEKILLRSYAVSALSEIADDETKAKLKALATANIESDVDDQLKGYSLRALWPCGISTEELFSLITRPKQDNFVGSYHMFLSKELIEHLQISDLPVALAWVKSQVADHKLSFTFREMADEIMRKAWDHLDSPEILEPFSIAAYYRLERHDNIIGDRGDSAFRKSLNQEEQKRRTLLEAMLQVINDHELDINVLAYSLIPLALSNDLPWLIQRCQNEESDVKKSNWIHIIQRVFDINEVTHIELIYNISQVEPLIEKSFAWLLNPVGLDEPGTKKIKENYYKMEKMKTRASNRVALDPPPEKRIKDLLYTCESKDPTAWWLLIRELTLEPDSTHYGNDLQSDITKFNGWKAANDLTKAQIIKTAEAYLMTQNPDTYDWLGKNTFYLPVLAGYKALLLLFKENNGSLLALSADLWKKWAPAILSFPASRKEDEEFQKTILAMAYQYAKDEIVNTLMVLIDKENSEQGQIYITHIISDIWDTNITNALLNKLTDQSLKPPCIGTLLGNLLDHETRIAEDFTQSFIRIPMPANGEDRTKAIIIASALMLHSKDSCWSFLLPILKQDTKFCMEVIEEVSSHLHEIKAIGQRLNEEQLADLFILMSNNYPHANDPQHEGGIVSRRTRISWWRDSILTTLKERGNPQACDALKRIHQELPNLEWVKWVILEAQNITRRKTWIPPQPTEILKLAINSENRVVQDGRQLLDVVIDSLKRLALNLQSENFEAQFLWNKDEKKNQYRPKDENAFSDYVKVHLDKDIAKRGIIINREVQIHRAERTDIHVDAITKRPNGEIYDVITVIIEVKGCWNHELNTAMEIQLVNKYLNNNHCKYGIYLVGWFNCDMWSREDYRRGDSPTLSIEEMQKQFDVQAEILSNPDLKIRALVINAAMR